MAEKNETTKLELIKGFLKQMEWVPASIEIDDSGLHTIILRAHIEIKEIEIKIRFKEDGLWLFISSKFLPKIEKNHILIYEKLLSINFKTTMTKFGLSKEKNIYALIELPLQDLDYSELKSALKRIVNDINKYILPCFELIRENNDK